MYNLKTIELRQSMIDVILANGPYEYFITLTFKYDQSDNKCYQQANFLLRLLNRKIFGRNNKTQHLEGYVFIEKHSHHRSSIHYHFAVKHHENFEITGKKHFIQHYIECLTRVKTSDKYNVFGNKTVRLDKINNSNELYSYLDKKELRNDYEQDLYEQLTSLMKIKKYDAFTVERCEDKKTYCERGLANYLTKRYEQDGINADFIRELTIDGFDR